MLIQWLLIRTEKKTSLVHCKHWNELLTKRFAKFLLIAMGYDNGDNQWEKKICSQPDPERLIPFPYIASFRSSHSGLRWKISP